jgi:hypothetical protein
MPELNDFYDDGLGWICRHCERQLEREHTAGETETGTKAPELPNRPLAKWTDKTRRFLTCPRCGITEAAELS